MTKSYEELEPILLVSGIPMGAINNIAQVVQHPQVEARRALVEMDHPRAGKVRMVGAPVRFSETPGSVRMLVLMLASIPTRSSSTSWASTLRRSLPFGNRSHRPKALTRSARIRRVRRVRRLFDSFGQCRGAAYRATHTKNIHAGILRALPPARPISAAGANGGARMLARIAGTVRFKEPLSFYTSSPLGGRSVLHRPTRP